MLYPLFVNNISALMYHPMNTVRTNAILQAVERKRMEASTHYQQAQAQRRNPNELVLPSSQPPHHMGQISPYGMPHMALSQPPAGPVRPEMGGRSLTFPAPPSDGYWNGSSMSSGQALAIDTVVNSRSMPATPASTPPANSLIQYPQQTYSEPRNQSLYSGNAPQQSMSMTRFGGPLPQPNSYMSQHDKNSMGPPASAGADNSRPSSRQNNGDVKEDEHSSHYAGQDDRKDDGYSTQQSNGYDHPDRNNYYAEVNGSSNAAQSTSPPQPAYETSNGTSRTNGTSNQWSGSYTTSPRGTSDQAIPRQPPFGLLNGESGDRDSGDSYSSGLPNINTSYTSSNGLPSAKRIRELDDDEDEDGRPSSRGEDTEGGLKRRKTLSSGSATTPPVGVSNRPRSQLVGGGRSSSRR